MGSHGNYGVSTWLWTSPFTTESIEKLFQKIASMGYNFVEIAVEGPELIERDKRGWIVFARSWKRSIFQA